MLSIRFALLWILLLLAMLSSMFEMMSALDESDFSRFFIWTSVAAVIAAVPSTL